jgi:hypothetical protein
MLATIVKQIIYGLLRMLLAGAGGWLMKQGIVSGGDFDFLLSGAAALIVASLLSVANKFGVREKIRAALELPGGSRGEDLKLAMEERKNGLPADFD